jgi:hypothetical protein
MDARLKDWIERTRELRLEPESPDPLGRGLVSERAWNPESAWRSAAHTLLSLVGQRQVSVSFEPGPSQADVRSGTANLDGTLLESLTTLDDASERLLGVAAHEGAHIAWSARPRKSWTRAFHWVHNVIEDERIERKAAHRFAPLATPLHVARRDLIEINSSDASFLAALFTIIRAPERLSQVQWETRKKELLHVISILDPFPATQQAVLRAATQIVKMIPPQEKKRLPPYPHLVAPVGDLMEVLRRRGARARLRIPGHLHIPERGRVVRPWPPVIWADAPPHASGYERVRGDVARQVAVLRERLRIVLPPRRETGLQRGSLDRRRLHKHRFDNRLFRGPELRRNPLAIAVILDLSGSMSGPHAEFGQRIAVLVAAAAEGLPGIRLYVYGHSADRSSDRRRRNPSTHITRFATPARGRVLSLGELPVGGNNRDAHAFRVIGQDLVRLGGAGSTRKLAVIIADGLPNAIGFDGPEAFDATRRAIVWLEQIWGPVIFVATGSHPRLNSLVSGPLYKYDPGNPVNGLVTMIQMALRKT